MQSEAIEAIQATADAVTAVQATSLTTISADDPAMAEDASERCDAVPANLAVLAPSVQRAVAYLRTSSAANVGADKDSEQRQRVAIEAYAKHAGLLIEQSFYDAAISGADAVDARPGFAALLQWCGDHDVHVIVCESASRFARDLIVQETGFAMLTKAGFKLIASDDEDAFAGNTPTSIMIRQILGAVSQFEKAGIVAKLKGARERKSAALGAKCAGRGRSYSAGRPELVAAAKLLRADGHSLRDVATELAIRHGFLTASGRPFGAEQVKLLLSYAADGVAA